MANTKERLRTMVRYSCLATSHALRIGLPLDCAKEISKLLDLYRGLPV
jgi:hypothetical protein